MVVRCEEAVVTGSLPRNRLKYARYLDKRMQTNPIRGHIHYRSPSKMLVKVIRGMLPHKTPRGAVRLPSPCLHFLVSLSLSLSGSVLRSFL